MEITIKVRRALTRLLKGSPLIYDTTTLAAHRARRADHVYDFIRGPHQHLAGARSENLVHDEGFIHGRRNERPAGRNFFHRLRPDANSRRTSGVALERAEARQPLSDCVGALRGWLRTFAKLPAVRGDAIFSWRRRKRRFSRDPGAAGQLVFPFRTRARQFLLAALPAAGRGRFRAHHRLAAGHLWLAADADPRRNAALHLATDLVVFHPRPSARRQMDFTRRKGSARNRIEK